MIVLALTGVLGSCCGRGESYADTSLRFSLDYYYSINSIELIGGHKSVQNYDDRVTLNPADTVCSFRITYSEGFYYSETDSVWTDTITLAYKFKPAYINNGCEEEMIMISNARVSNTTFTKAEIIDQYNGYQTVQITP
jgi:hypothetical protein